MAFGHSAISVQRESQAVSPVCRVFVSHPLRGSGPCTVHTGTGKGAVWVAVSSCKSSRQRASPLPQPLPLWGHLGEQPSNTYKGSRHELRGGLASDPTQGWSARWMKVGGDKEASHQRSQQRINCSHGPTGYAHPFGTLALLRPHVASHWN